MSKIKKIDEMAVLKTRIHTKRRAAKYVLTDMWIQDDPSTDGYYPHIKNRVGDDLKKLVKKFLKRISVLISMKTSLPIWSIQIMRFGLLIQIVM